ncbi:MULTISPECIES: peptide chain release factor N(5)-glutamine methyltransferase [unclassified Rhizobium]|uniref:peptide chain release factor N(5)-glutamine methyltransferase n=1 Tax=unclassified Rhizobium TaxID=2613769 RepID=UPI001C838FE2|nr:MULTISPECIES: peptide chain release factor N(5)-glutamine methyltransferase [unclassified Rhizobium]MBX5218599.1 peptide chain release factor N(5)-glutamine methyltransferase [Rhizobium sp. NLR9a]MBX5248636.1 peptide chain release factor N(5)-glutamine methyltransferase [Rhizobium sp. NLR3b]MBX5273014.1 peptide chain release factor N(5)-glutamine methyltransferase [Rhizobium sp. NLR17b]MBX5279301.1 peptide chain release factor N(5)-glutamine methyltransferase [Rhizobium sp. NLR13a]MBX528535
MSATVADMLAEARRRFTEAGIVDPVTDARLLVAGLLKLSSTELLTRSTERLSSDQAETISRAMERRLGHEPVHRILGAREFYGLPLGLSAETLEPRPDTEILVDTVLPYLKDLAKPQRHLHILDIGTGSGAICLALLSECPEASGIGSDISADALRTAKSNAERNGLQDRFQAVQSKWFENIQGSFHAIVSNPPYIASSVIHDLAPEVTKFDPVAALDGGPDGLDAYKAIAKDAARFMRPDGVLGLEIGYDQRNDVTALFEAKGFRCLKSVKDYGQNDRALVFALA